MSDFFTAKTNNDEIIAVIRASGHIVNISEPQKSAVKITLRDENGINYSAWALEEDAITEVAKASVEDEVNIDFRIEVASGHPSVHVLEVFTDENKTKRILSSIDDIVSEKSLTNPEDDFEFMEETTFTKEDLDEYSKRQKPAVKEGSYGELFNSERGPNYGSGALIAATSADVSTRELLLRGDIVKINEFYTPDAEKIVDSHAKLLLQVANTVQLKLYDKRPGAIVDMNANSHSRIRGVMLDTLKKGIFINEETNEAIYHLWDKENNSPNVEAAQKLIDIVYSRMRHLGRLIIDPEIHKPEELFEIFN